MQVLNCNTSVCKKVVIPSPSKTVSTPNITVVVDKPAGLKIASANVSHGTIADNVWTIVSLPAGEDAVLDVCFNPADCDVSPTGKGGNVTISTTANETNLDNNVMPFTLEYITCGEIEDCVTDLNIFESDGVTTDSERFIELLSDNSTSSSFTIKTDNSAFVEPIILNLQNETFSDDSPTVKLFSGDNYNTSQAGRALLNSQWLKLENQYNGGIEMLQSNPKIFGGPSQAQNSQLDFQAASIVIQPTGIANFEGVKYSGDFSGDYTDRSLVDKEYVDDRTNTGVITVITNAIGEGTFTIGNTTFVPPNIILTLTDGGEMRTIHLVSTVGNVVNFIAYNASGPLNAISVDVNWSY